MSAGPTSADGRRIAVPEFAMIVLIGASGSGKSSFARRHFRPTEILSSDICRGLVCDDENDQAATPDAFALLQTILELRLKGRRLAVIDATNVRPEDRRKLVEVARRFHALSVAIVLDPGEEICRARNAERPDRAFGPHVVRNQMAALRRGLRGLAREGFRQVHHLGSPAEIDGAEITRQRLWTDRRDEAGPFDIVGDVHGCADELEALLTRLGYGIERREEDGEPRYRVTPPPGRKAVFVGDLVDRGPRVADSLRIAMDMVEDGVALCVLGNHEAKVEKWLDGRNVKVAHGLQATIDDLARQSDAFRARAKGFIGGLVSHYLLDGGRLAVAHAGIKEEMQGRASGAIRGFCLFGETTGETDEFGLPVRHEWAAEYRGPARVVYGHTPVVEPAWLNNTLCVDTGCVFGGRLTALRYPEMETVSVPAARVHAEPVRPLGPAPTGGTSPQAEADDLLDLADVSGKRIVTTRLLPSVTIREENNAAALEVMSRFAIDPKWLIYLPPTMSPCETSAEAGYLEHPREAFAYYRREGLRTVVAQEKHMGSRALMVVCRDADTARARFGVGSGEIGAVTTRSGRAFFTDPAQRDAVLGRARDALVATGAFDELGSDWVLLDAEIMPWSAKAQALIATQYGPTGAAARIGLAAAQEALARAAGGGLQLEALARKTAERLAAAEAFSAVVRGYAWPVAGIDDLKIAPFHLLASEGQVHSDKPHTWHGERLAPLAGADPLFKATRVLGIDLDSEAEVERGIQWWLDLTAEGGEGMVVKPEAFLARGRRGITQPAIKCRGREYLRLIYGPDYDRPEHLDRLRQRGLGAKRSLAFREFALGLEALDRFVARAPLRRVHECVFGVLALESEPVDPRL
ncbi:polynucleotide kinase-phosphatase [Methylorubrum salsuginis]|uniref:Polynucleotide 3'-phosphatase/polynucleotide 5'-hydroxyl-kinase/polynucleotide 2',3'-cyclic phosphate phosphodiesterase n=1 Tax=Methylorubrum salsuginis TaxID=414703 RepID=A0A1I3Y6J1_9HYPH|nr:polynucleotide kinase-phosphatase [Methylorubrum salsuginis]SFK27310.1 polynucleotide 3'-phosphatase/polynucleotide 5'-hydroxyl-kinase/polynucleotide 2',3'-cyclic phosphate phosphodiesterase [Methylorubrum salsuginis]